MDETKTNHAEEPLAGVPPPMEPEEGKNQKPIGPVAGIIVVVVLIVLGGLYFWSDRMGNRTEDKGPSAEEIRNEMDPVAESLAEQGNSDDLEAIEADLEASSYEELDAEFENIEAEFN